MALQDWQKDFILLATQVGALSFGEFRLKSGRISPYFFNAGRFYQGSSLARLGACYAGCITERQIECDFLFGPAYKGIPLAVATAMQLHLRYGRDIPYSFNRKEAKDHGEGGIFVGADPKGRALVVDDVITAGTAVREVLAMLPDSVSGVSVLIGLDRRERGQQSELSAVEELRQDGIEVQSIVTLEDIRQYIADEMVDAELLERIDHYREAYGVRS